MNKRFSIIICFIASILLSSCGRQQNAMDTDKYLPGQDMQYFSVSDTYKTASIQETDTGCYVYHNGFIYVYDREQGIIEPLCQKTNCLHDRETDRNKRTECNAYLDNIQENAGSVSLMLYKDHIYAFYESNDTEPEIHFPGTLVRIATDGSSKDILLKADSPDIPMLHRGYIYYYTQNYQVEEASGIVGEASICRINIESGNAKPEVIFTAPKEVNGYGFLRGYGNHIYFTLHYKNEEGHPSTYVFDLKSKEASELKESLSGYPAWFKERLYMREFLFEEDYNFETPVYRLNWDGSSKETVMEKMPQGYAVYSDEEYLYLDNQFLCELYGTKRQVLVYNEKLEQVDEFTYPGTVDTRITPPIGGEKYQYLMYNDEETSEWGLYIWDKSVIGTLRGSAYTQTKVPYAKPGQDNPEGTDEGSGSRTDEAREYVCEIEDWSEEELTRTAVKSPDMIGDSTAEGELSFDEKSVHAATVHETDSIKVTEVWGYYQMGNSVFKNGYTVTVTGKDSAEADLELPEGAEKYLGAQARHYVEKDGFSWQDFTSFGQTKKAKP